MNECIIYDEVSTLLLTFPPLLSPGPVTMRFAYMRYHI